MPTSPPTAVRKTYRVCAVSRRFAVACQFASGALWPQGWIYNQLCLIVAGMARTSAFEQLNPGQRNAARFGARGESGAFRSGPLLIVAGAGTGKTNTLAHRVAHLVLEGVSPEC